MSEETVLKHLQDLDENKAQGLDNQSRKFLKDGATVLAKPISQICNLSIKYSIFPSDCKIAKLKPLFKKGSKTDPQNYRPISLLPLVSKIIEQVIMIKHNVFSTMMQFTNTSQVLENFSPLSHV